MSYRTHKCGKIDSKLAGTEVEVVGWVNKKGIQIIFNDQGLSPCGNYKLENEMVSYIGKE